MTNIKRLIAEESDSADVGMALLEIWALKFYLTLEIRI